MVSTKLANFAVNLVGPSFIYRLVGPTGASANDVAKAVLMAKGIFNIEKCWLQIAALDYKVQADT